MGNAMLSLPLLPSLIPEKLWAQVSAQQKNFIGVLGFHGLFRMYGPQSILMPRTPLGTTSLSGFTPLDVPNRHRIHSQALETLRVQNGGSISNLIDSSFNPYLSKMLMMQGLDYLALGWFHHNGAFGNFASTAGDSGNAAAATIDQVMAYSSNFYKNPSLVGRSVGYTARQTEVQSGTGHYGGCFTFSNPGDKVNSSIVGRTGFSNPGTLWDQYFGSSTQQTPRKISLVDRVIKDYQSLRTNPRLGSEDRSRVDQHINLLFETEKRVRAVANVCTSLRPASSLTDRALILSAFNDVIVSLIACGLCHSFMGWGHAIISPDDSEAWHRWAHEGYDNDNDVITNQSSYNSLVEQNRVVLKTMCLDLVRKLDGIGQLDNSLVALIYEHNKRGHESWNVPAITFGSAGGIFKTGQYVDYRNLNTGDDAVFSRLGYPINQLLANMLQASGVPPAEYEALNKSAFSSSLFAPRSGYSVSRIHPDAVSKFSSNYSSRWQGHNLSDWLPLIRA